MERELVSHPGLKCFRVITGATTSELARKVRLQREKWDEEWAKRLKAKQNKRMREQQAHEKDQKVRLAADLTKEAEAAISEIENVLHDSLAKEHRIDWESLKDRTPFLAPRPTPPSYPAAPEKPHRDALMSAKPDPKGEHYQPRFDLLDYLLRHRKRRKIERANSTYQHALNSWREKVREFNDQVQHYNSRLKELPNVHSENLARYRQELWRWEAGRSAFQTDQMSRNAQVDARRDAYRRHDREAVLEYCEAILSNSQYPSFCPNNYELDYAEE